MQLSHKNCDWCANINFHIRHFCCLSFAFYRSAQHTDPKCLSLGWNYSQCVDIIWNELKHTAAGGSCEQQQKSTRDATDATNISRKIEIKMKMKVFKPNCLQWKTVFISLVAATAAVIVIVIVVVVAPKQKWTTEKVVLKMTFDVIIAGKRSTLPRAKNDKMQNDFTTNQIIKYMRTHRLQYRKCWVHTKPHTQHTFPHFYISLDVNKSKRIKLCRGKK